MSVRVRHPPEVVPSAALLTFDVERWAPADIARGDPWRPTRAHEAWCAARQAWVDAGGRWPGGEDQREFQEAMSTPDEIWVESSTR